MTKKIEKIILILLISYSIYISLIVGMGWDEIVHQKNGKNLIRYLFSIGNLEYRSLGLPFHFGFYDAFSHFVSLNFPIKYSVFSHHITNLFFSIMTIIGISQLTKFLFNKKLSKFVYVITFLNPIFFGHMSVNPKDTIIAFALVWINLLFLKYLKFQKIDFKRTRYIYFIALILSIGLSIRLTFIATLIPIFLIFIYEVAFNKKNSFILKHFLIDFLKIFLISYLVTIAFWPEMHKNIFTQNEIISKYFNSLINGEYGLYWGLIDGQAYNLSNVPKNYLYVNLFYRMPEFFVFSLPILIFILFYDFNFFKNRFLNFKKNLIYSSCFIIVPILIITLMSVKANNGLRYFLFLLFFLSIVPALVIFYLYENKKKILNKVILFFLIISFCSYFINFIRIAPYHYTYINYFNGKFSNNLNKFQNDYWGLSIKELIGKFETSYPIDRHQKYKIAFCGVSLDIAQYYLDKIKNFNYIKVSSNEDYDFIVMVNLLNGDRSSTFKNIKSCYTQFSGNDLFSVERSELKLSIIRDNHKNN